MADAPTLYGSTCAQAQAHLRAGTRWAGRYPIGTEAEAEFRIPGRWAATADLMRRTDPKIRQFNAAVVDPILAATFEVVPGVGPNAERNADYVRRAFGIGGKNAPKRRDGPTLTSGDRKGGGRRTWVVCGVWPRAEL